MSLRLLFIGSWLALACAQLEAAQSLQHVLDKQRVICPSSHWLFSGAMQQ